MTYAANVRSLEPLIADHRIQFVKGDIGDAALMQRLFNEHKFSRVAHLAAEGGQAESHEFRIDALAIAIEPAAEGTP